METMQPPAKDLALAAFNAAKILEREETLVKANEAYAAGEPVMPDSTYDSHWREHERDRQLHPEFFDKESAAYLFIDNDTILNKVGAAPAKTSGFRKVKHVTPMGSINDVFEGHGAAQYEELLAFVRDMEKRLGNDAWPIQVEPKVDGVAVKLVFNHGLLSLGVTRGDGEVGDDITDNLRISGIVPQSIVPDEPWNGTTANPLNAENLEVVGEVYMPVQAFEIANRQRERKGLKLWANPRNAAAGAIKLLDAEELKTRPLAFVRHDVSCTPWINGMDLTVRIEVFSWKALIAAIEQTRHGVYPFATDGAVVKLASPQAREIVGRGTRAPNWACAFKFLPVQAETILEGVDVQVGRSGVLTPVARLKPILIDGSTVSNATLNNEAWIQERGLRIGDTVLLQKAGAIIPEIVESVTRTRFLDEVSTYLRESDPSLSAEDVAFHAGYKEADDRPPFSLVDHLGGKCPSCGSTDLQKQEIAGDDEGAKWCCMNTSGCPAQLSSQIEHFCSRGCLDIEGIGENASIAIADRVSGKGFQLIELVTCWRVEDLAISRWESESGSQMTFGESRAKKARAALDRAKSLPLHRWLRAFGIRSVGENTSKEVSRLFETPRALIDQYRRDINGRPFILDIIAADEKDSPELAPYQISSKLGPVSANALLAFIGSTHGAAALEVLSEWDVRSTNYDPKPEASDAKPLFGKTFAITGTLSVGRDEMKALIESKGGKVSGSVSKKTNYLIQGVGGGSKGEAAAKNGVSILDEAALRAML